MVGLIRRARDVFRARAGEPEPAAHFAWEVKPAPDRIVAIGDLHGDVAAFGAILRASKLVNERGTWSGGAAHLVLLGDLLYTLDRDAGAAVRARAHAALVPRSGPNLWRRIARFFARLFGRDRR